jgi:hypothetical protein
MEDVTEIPENMIEWDEKVTPDLLAEDMHAAQLEIQNPKKDAENPFFESQYLSLPALLDLLRGVYNKHGITIVQDVLSSDGRVGCRTILMHKSGSRWTSGALLLPLVKQDPQSCGSAISYARRYQLQAVAGISGVDDDAETATDHARPSIQQPRPAVGPAAGEVTTKVLSIGRVSDRHPFVITTNDGDFTTYDKNIPKEAELARATGADFSFKWNKNPNPKYNDRIIVSEKKNEEAPF